LLVLLNRPQKASDFQNIAYPIMELGFDMGEYFSVQTYSQEEWEAMRFLPMRLNEKGAAIPPRPLLGLIEN